MNYLQVQCHRCGAKAGGDCIPLGSSASETLPHIARRKLAILQEFEITAVLAELQIPCPNGCLDRPPFICPLCDNSGWCDAEKAREVMLKREKDMRITYRTCLMKDQIPTPVEIGARTARAKGYDRPEVWPIPSEPSENIT